MKLLSAIAAVWPANTDNLTTSFDGETTGLCQLTLLPITVKIPLCSYSVKSLISTTTLETLWLRRFALRTRTPELRVEWHGVVSATLTAKPALYASAVWHQRVRGRECRLFISFALSVLHNLPGGWANPALPKQPKSEIAKCVECAEFICAFAIVAEGNFPKLEGHVHP